MLERAAISLNKTVDVLRAVGEPTRLRLLALLSKSDLTVTDLIEILGQSQPRISRHLKLLAEAGLLERYQEGAWAYFRMIDEGANVSIVSYLLAQLDSSDTQVQRDASRLDAVRAKRAARAEAYFASNAANWSRLRNMHIDEQQVEKTILSMIGNERVHSLLDLGTGTGRLLELLKDHYAKAIGIDGSRDMLAVARSTIDRAGLSQAQVRQSSITMLPTPMNAFDLVTIHQVLHYLDDPSDAISEAAKALAPGGRLLIVDFAPHSVEELRTKQAHVRLGFSHEQMNGWLESAGLAVVETRDLTPIEKSHDGAELLTVTLWLAKDRRILMADNSANPDQNIKIGIV